VNKSLTVVCALEGREEFQNRNSSNALIMPKHRSNSCDAHHNWNINFKALFLNDYN